MAFDLASVLADVSKSDTGREQIEYIPLDKLDADSHNFYGISEIEPLADNIAMCGLQQPIRVRQQEDGRYVIVSGHRRRAALMMLVTDGHEEWRDAPCIVENDAASPTLQQLRLIYANANTRVMTSAELGEQAAQVEKLLYQLKEEGYEFPGRMRDHVAQAVNASKTKLARLKVIRDNLAECWKPHYKNGAVCESTAYELAKFPAEWQEIIYKAKGGSPRSLFIDTVKSFGSKFNSLAALKCSHGCDGGCEHISVMMTKNCKELYTTPCSRCCSECADLLTCKSSCKLAAARKKKLRDTAKRAEARAAEAQAKREQPAIEFIRGVYERVGKARNSAGVTVRQLYKAQGRSYIVADDQKQVDLETGASKVSTNTTLPFGYSFFERDAKALCGVADALHCSTDYLLGRTETPEMAQKENMSNSGTGWQTGKPAEPGRYVVMVKFSSIKEGTPQKLDWDGNDWMIFGESACLEPSQIIGWMPMPETLEPPDSALNDSCITGISPSGHCGAAACCGSAHTCCLQCPDDCSIRCGWLDAAEEVGGCK